MLHVEHLVDTLRFFGKGGEYGDPYDTVATVVVCGDLAFLCGMHGQMNRGFWMEMQAELRARGIVDLLTFRDGARVWYDLDGDRVTIQRGVRFPVVDVSP